MRKVLQAKRIDDGTPVGDPVDVTGRSDRQVDRITSGMLINLHPDLFVDEIDIEEDDNDDRTE